MKENSSSNKFHQKLCWKKATEDQKLDYNDNLFRRLMKLESPESVNCCNDIKCKTDAHKKDLDKYVTDVMESINQSGFETIPKVAPKKKSLKSTAGWKTYVEPYQEKARFWYSIWLSAGKPLNTVLHNIMKKNRNQFHYQIRKCKRVENFLINQKLIENCLDDNNDLFKEIKRQRGPDTSENVTIDGASGDNIPNKFAEVYEELYNRENDEESVSAMLDSINIKLGEDSFEEIDKINSNLIKEAVKNIQASKSDPNYEFTSDFLKHAPDILYEHLARIIKSFLIHGHVTQSLLLASLVPLVKDKLGDLCSSSNYRSIAISSLILKLLDWVIILQYGHLLKLDDFQFGFQKNNSTSLCSWMAFETIDLYIRNGSTVFGALMDCTKAFDTVVHSKLFKKLLEASVPAIIVRLLIHIYRAQTAEVRWKGQSSEEFKISNGVRQGAVLSPVLFCFYMNDLFLTLKKGRTGCYIGNYFAGVFGYADDLLLLCPSRSGLQRMLDTAYKYASDHRISFSTNPVPEKSKTKGIIFSSKPLNWQPTPVNLCGNPLPWVKSAKYLGNNLTGIIDGLAQDVKIKRARFIERNIELNQEFQFAHPEIKTRINQIYNSSFSGSVLWDLTSRNVEMLENSWSVSIRHMWGLPLASHRFLVEALGGTHARTMLFSRFASFIQSLLRSEKAPVLLLLFKVCDNVNTITGKNIRYILTETKNKDIFQLNLKKLKREYRFSTVKKEDNWKIGFMKELVELKHSNLEQEDLELSVEEVDTIIEYLATC